MYLYVPISDSYVLALLCYSYVTRMYLFVPVCQSYVLVCTRRYLYVTVTLLVLLLWCFGHPSRQP